MVGLALADPGHHCGDHHYRRGPQAPGRRWRRRRRQWRDLTNDGAPPSPHHPVGMKGGGALERLRGSAFPVPIPIACGFARVDTALRARLTPVYELCQPPPPKKKPKTLPPLFPAPRAEHVSLSLGCCPCRVHSILRCSTWAGAHRHGHAHRSRCTGAHVDGTPNPPPTAGAHIHIVRMAPIHTPTLTLASIRNRRRAPTHDAAARHCEGRLGRGGRGSGSAARRHKGSHIRVV
mmetsp:Transcript_475/g.1343  ORF Transcript_475/g.1343 Transcript_475/m.1343 type:complete len:234 (-) Transcript_475:703-1404(-)